MAKGENYKQFVEKFKQKKTTDDCYTPPEVYEAVKGWAIKEYGIEGREIVRPFYPCYDYEKYQYPDNCVVIDNPPFSILSKIVKYYIEKGIKYFLFSPTMTLFSANTDSCHIITATNITYENGANINTSFITNLDEARIRTANDLRDNIIAIQCKNKRKATKYDYPKNLITAARLQTYISSGIDFKIPKDEAYFIRALDEQRKTKGSQHIFGGGFLVSDRFAQIIGTMQKQINSKVIKYELSKQEKETIKQLNKEV
jgi:hypothetical protein